MVWCVCVSLSCYMGIGLSLLLYPIKNQQKKLKYMVLEEKVKARARLGLPAAGKNGGAPLLGRMATKAQYEENERVEANVDWRKVRASVRVSTDVFLWGGRRAGRGNKMFFLNQLANHDTIFTCRSRTPSSPSRPSACRRASGPAP